MFRDIGIEELLVILIVVLLVFGASKLPQIGEDLGKAVRKFRQALSGEEDRIKAQTNTTEAQNSDGNQHNG